MDSLKIVAMAPAVLLCSGLVAGKASALPVDDGLASASKLPMA